MITIIIPTLDPGRARLTDEAAGAWAPINKAALLIVHDEGGEGFTKTVNRGLQQVTEDHICLLNDDAEPLTDGWLALLQEAFDDERVGFAGPSGPCRTEPQNRGIPGMAFGMVTVSHLAGFCLLVRRAVLDQVGLLDEELIHYGSEVDLQWRAKEKGWVSVWVRHVYVDHGLHEPIGEWWRHDQAVLRGKWGRA